MSYKKFVFNNLPESLNEFSALIGDRKDPFNIATLYILALATYMNDSALSLRMINALKGPESLSDFEKSFIKGVLTDEPYLPLSFFEGATPDNGYTAPLPLVIKAYETEDSDRLSPNGFKSIYFKSSGAEIKRAIRVRCIESTGTWYYWQQYIMDGIRRPKNLGKWS